MSAVGHRERGGDSREKNNGVQVCVCVGKQTVAHVQSRKTAFLNNAQNPHFLWFWWCFYLGWWVWGSCSPIGRTPVGWDRCRSDPRGSCNTSARDLETRGRRHINAVSRCWFKSWQRWRCFRWVRPKNKQTNKTIPPVFISSNLASALLIYFSEFKGLVFLWQGKITNNLKSIKLKPRLLKGLLLVVFAVFLFTIKNKRLSSMLTEAKQGEADSKAKHCRAPHHGELVASEVKSEVRI